MKTSLSLFLALFTASGLAASSAATVAITDLSDLGPADETLTAFSKTLPTYNGRTVNGVTTVDVKDATFALSVDFDDPAGAGTDNEVLWETGGGTVGFSLVYVPSTMTLTLRQVSNGGNTILSIDRVISTTEKAAGDLELVWTFDTDGSVGGDPQIELYVDGISTGTASDASSEADWSGGNGAGLGGFNSGVAAGGGNSNLPNVVDFADGTVNYTTGLRFWADTHASFIPEPSAFALLCGGLGLALLRRRR